MSISRLIVGVFFILLGIVFLVFVGVIDGPGVDAGGILIGIFFLILGGFVLFNREEDVIETRMDEVPKRKSLNKKISKK